MRKNSWLLAVPWALAFFSCTVFEGPSSRTLSTDDSGAVFLFQESPTLEAKSWSYQSGIGQSALGKVNPVFFDLEQSPLKTPGTRIRLNLFADVAMTAIVEKARITQDGLAARGRLEGIEASTFLATVSGNALSAVVRLDTLGTYRVEFGRNGSHRAIKQNSFEPSEPIEPVAPALAPLPATGPLVLPRAAAMSSRVLDIMVVYTADALAGAGSTSAMNSLIDAAIEEANETYSNSGIDVELNLVYRGPVTYTESNNMTTDLNRVTNTTDGYLDNVHALRNTYAADLVTLVTETSGGYYAGLGWIMRPVSSSFQAYAFNVVMRAYLVGQFVLPHEIGHNLGCQHDAQNATSAGAYTYSKGYRFYGDNGVQYRSVMAYAPGTRIAYFSNPGVRYRNRPTGTASANNVLTINTTAPTMAAFRGTNQAPSITLSIPGGRNTFGSPTNLILSALIDDDQGVDSVTFFAGTTRLGISRSHPFRFAWTGASGGSSTLTARVYDKGGLTTLSDGIDITLNSSSLPSPWNDAFLGLKGETGGASFSGGSYTLQSAGTDFLTTSDGGHFAYQPVTGNATLTARVVSMENTDATAKAGLMFRDTASTGGKNTFISLLPDGSAKIQGRSARNGSTSVYYNGTLTVPYYLGLFRKANTVAAYASTDGDNWVFLRSLATTLPATYLAGLAATSSDTMEENTSVFDDVSVSASVNFPPQTALSGPLAGRSYHAGTAIPLTATASDLDGAGTIVSVDFYNGATLLGTDNASPFAYNWTATSGAASLRSLVTDTGGRTTYSQPLAVTINAAGTLTVNPTKDAYVRDGGYANTNYGTSLTVIVKANATTAQSYQAYMTFPISSVSTISGASLRVYGRINAVGSVSVNVFAVSDTAWIEAGTAGIKWNSKPASGSLLGTATYSSTTLAWQSLDVGAYVSGRKSAGAAFVTFAFVGSAASTPYAAVNARTVGENTGRPELILTP